MEQARLLTATDPVIAQGEMIAEYHVWYGSAAAMMLPELHQRLIPPRKLGSECSFKVAPDLLLQFF